MPYQRAILSFQQLVFFLGFGIAGWLIAALLLRFLGPMGIYDGGARVLTYALIIPDTVPFIWLAAWLGGAREGQLFLGFSISTAMAMLCDGMALAWFPTLYGATVPLHAGAGGTILWGAGVGIFLAWVMDRRPFTKAHAPAHPSQQP